MAAVPPARQARARCLRASGAVALVAALAGCGSSHTAHPYTGRVYSVAEVRRAFAALGLELHRDGKPAQGVVTLVNDLRLGPQRIPSPARAVTVAIGGRHPGEVAMPRNVEITKYANITVLSTQLFLDEVRGAVSTLRWGVARPARGVIVPGTSIDGLWVGETRASVEKRFGAGHAIRRGVVSYFGGHLIADYWFHDGLYDYVQYVETRWSGYRTRSGVHVGSSRRALRSLYVTCTSLNCLLLAGPRPDPLGTEFWLRGGKVVDITIGRFG